MSQNNTKFVNNFLTPETLAIIILLQESFKENEQSTELTSILIDKIQKFYSEGNGTNLESFLSSLQKDLPSKHQNLIQIIRNNFNNFIQINDVFKYFSITLKSLRSNRNGRLEQGNFIDIFVRRCLLTFTKWSFSELVRFHSDLQNYKNPDFQNMSNNTFAVEKKLENFKTILENSFSAGSSQNSQLNSKFLNEINEIKSSQPLTKMDFLSYKVNIKDNQPIEGLDNLHKYFDKSLNHLLQVTEQAADKPVTTNKINHAILNLANLNFKMGFYDEVLRGVSEALRISQNNTDDESINQCLCYLYQIAGILGNHEDQINLLEYAISHSLNLNHPNLMLFSCLYYCNLERFYDVGKGESGYLKSRNISWTNALHYASKKIITGYESGFKLKEISLMKGLTIPRALEAVVKSLNLMKLAKPNVALMQIGVVYESLNKELLLFDKIAIQLYESAYWISKFDWQYGLKTLLESVNSNDCKNNSYFLYYWYLIHYYVFLNRGMFEYCDDLEVILTNEFKNLHEIILYSGFWGAKIEKKLAANHMEDAFYSVIKFIEFCESKGLFKMILKGYIFRLELLYKSQKEFKGLLLVEELLLKIKDYEAFEYETLVLCYKAAFLKNLGLIYDAFQILKDLERDSQGRLFNSDLKTQAFFFEIKGFCLLTQKVKEINPSFQTLRKNGLEAFNHALHRYIKLGNLQKCKEIYYIQARVLDELEKNQEKEEVAGLFLKTIELQEKFEGMRNIGVNMLKSLDLIFWQEEIAKIIEENLKVVLFFD